MSLLFILFCISFVNSVSVVKTAGGGESLPQSVVSYVGRRQSVGIRGQLLCGTMPLTNTKVKLWDEDYGIDPDDLLGETVTNATGHFEVFGSQTEIMNIDPRLNIYHQCNKKGSCKRKVTFLVPEKYISKGDKVQKWFEFGSLNMEIITKGETSYCL